MEKITYDWLQAAVMGGAILGGGGGGSSQEGERFAQLALKFDDPTISSIGRLADDLLIVTVSAVGAPSSKDKYVTPLHYVKALEILNDQVGGEVGGLMTNEIGGFAVINGLIQSAVSGIPVIDAACNGRAHPTSDMGSIGLSQKEDYVAHQVAVGGAKEKKRYVEIYAKGSLSRVSKIIRKAAVEAGGLVAVARNPVSVQYARENAAVGALSQTVELGEAFLAEETAQGRINKVVTKLQASVEVEGEVLAVELTSRGGFDVGKVKLKESSLTYWNEYMTLDRGRKRIATFPDLITTMDLETGQPIGSAEIQEGQQVAVITVPAENLNLGAGMKDRVLLQEVEKAIGKEIIKYSSWG